MGEADGLDFVVSIDGVELGFDQIIFLSLFREEGGVSGQRSFIGWVYMVM